MIRQHWLSVTVGLLGAAALASCGDDGGDSTGGTSIARARVAEALTAGLSVANGTVSLLEGEDLPESTVVSLVISQEDEPVSLVPDEVTILEFDVENDDEDEEVVATLLQFEDSADTLEISDIEAEGDAGASNPHFALELRSSSSICDDLCADEFELNVFMKAKLSNGGIGARGMRRVKLDCRSSSKSCEEEEPSGDGDGDGDTTGDGDGDGDGDGQGATLAGQFRRNVLMVEGALCTCAQTPTIADCARADQWLGPDERSCISDAITAGETGPEVSAMITRLGQLGSSMQCQRDAIFEMVFTTEEARDSVPMSFVECDADGNSFVVAGSAPVDAGAP